VEFHRKLLVGASAAGMATIAIVPDVASSDFVRRELGLPALNIVVSSLRSLGFTGTPTIAVLDPEHHVEHLWIGLLPRYLQDIITLQILSNRHVLLTQDSSEIYEVSSKGVLSAKSLYPAARIIARPTDSELSVLLDNNALLDISPRDTFARQGRPHAINIPYDEVAVRARYELKKSVSWVLDCSRVDPAACDLAGYLLVKAGFTKLLVLDRGAIGILCQTTPTT
jgi:hypothetical protein